MVFGSTASIRQHSSGASVIQLGGHRRAVLAVPAFRGQRLRRFVVKAGAGEGNKGERQPWDFGRFVRTLLYFNEPPPLDKLLQRLVEQPLKLLQGVASGDMETQKSAVMTVLTPGVGSASASEGGASSSGRDQGGIVLVTGATGGVGKRVVQLLLQRGSHVRALVRDMDKAQKLLGPLVNNVPGRLELVAADITQRKTLLPSMFAGVSKVVGCTAVKVAPKEGDTQDRAKYYQGIKFYDPEIVGDTPETVEYVGMQNLVDAVKEHVGLKDGKLIFSGRDKGSQIAWGALDDVVMGGVSESRFQISPSGGEDGGPVGVFTGTVRTENSGGFTSVRTKNFEPALDLSAYAGLQLRVKGNGQRFKMILRTDTNWDGIGYCKSFDTTADQWETITLPFSEFIGVFRAKTVKDATLNPSSIVSIQLMLSKFEYDGALNPNFTPGPFSLPVQSIKAYLPEPVRPRFVLVSSAGVTRPNRPGINVDMEPPAVKLNDALGGILTYKLKGEDVVRGSGMPYAVVRPCALTEEPAGAPLEVDQGDVIKGKISRDDVAELCVALLDLPVGLDTTFEIKSTVPFSTPWAPEGQVEQRDWKQLLESSQIKPGVTGKTINGVYTGKEPEESVAQKSQQAAVV